jgi:hypothetical protein
MLYRGSLFVSPRAALARVAELRPIYNARLARAGRTAVFLRIMNFLTTAELESLRAIVRDARLVDGPLAQQASQIGFAALQRSEQARNFEYVISNLHRMWAG